jgi:hypothetical protein
MLNIFDCLHGQLLCWPASGNGAGSRKTSTSASLIHASKKGVAVEVEFMLVDKYVAWTEDLEGLDDADKDT